MANYCEVCNKGVVYGNKVSHSHRKSNRTWKPNVHKVTVLEGGTPKKMYVCTRCLRSAKVVRDI